MATKPTNFNVNLADLQKILLQIKIGEANASRLDPVTGQIVAGTPIDQLVSHPVAPEGIRTVSGIYNNIIPGRQTYGSADQPMPNLLDQVWRAGEDNPRTPGVVDITSYTQLTGSVYDSSPRTISNLISDQTLGNRAAVIAALERTGSADPFADAERVMGADVAAQAAAAALAVAQTELNAATAAWQPANAATVAALAARDQDQLELDAAEDNLATQNVEFQAASDTYVAAVDTLLNLLNNGGTPAQIAAASAAVVTAQAALELEEADVDAAQLVVDMATLDLEATQATYEAAVATEAPLLAIVNTETAERDAAQALATQAANTAATIVDELGLVINPDNGTIQIGAIAPDIGISAPFNSWMTLFGQFFDHGLDLISKGGHGNVFIPLQPDDPLYVPGSPTNFMVLTRATVASSDPGADGVLGTADDIRQFNNVTTPFVDQNQTYTSHASHQVFLREYEKVTINGVERIVSTGHMLDGATGGIANWGETKAQAREMLGIQLVDMDVLNVPLLATDEYGQLLRGPNGYAQIVVLGTNGPELMEANPADNGGLGTLLPPTTVRTGHAFLDDIAHNAAPGLVDHDRNPLTAPIAKTADTDTDTGNAIPLNQFGVATTYDNELLDRHFITGDGRGNENIGLTAVHHIFHNEHNRTLEANKITLLQSGDRAVINEWLLVPLSDADPIPTDPTQLIWNGERLFQAARFTTEMQYQHLVFEEFGRKIAPTINPFVFSNSADINPAIFSEFANVVYRFGHSMLTETVDRLDWDGTTLQDNPIGLLEAFLNPVAYDEGLEGTGVTANEAAGQIILGMTRQQGAQIDEFITDALRNNLVGLPLDLGALNIARGRDTGIPSFNDARAQFYEMSGDSRVRPFTNWVDFAQNMENPASIVNFIAAYGTHPSITSATTLAGKRAAAEALVFGGVDAPTDRLNFLNATGAYAGGSLGGLNNVDFWIGGLAEAKEEFVGMLAPTFQFVFELQMENLQNGDRFYYLSRTQGMNLLNQLESNTFSQLVMRNTDLGEFGMPHLPGNLFDTVSHILEINQALQQHADPEESDPVLAALRPQVERIDTDGDGDTDVLRYNGPDHVVLGGNEEDNVLTGSIGDDTLWGDGGNDRLEGGLGNDRVFGGAGDDIITNLGGDDFLHGQDGDDVISMGQGLVLAFGDKGKDAIFHGSDDMESFAGEGDDFILGNSGNDIILAGEGNDWVEGGDGFDAIAGENSELFFNSDIVGHDVLNGQGNDTDYDGESGDDIMVQGDGIQRSNGMFGFDWAIHKGDMQAANSDLGIPFFPAQTQFTLRDRFDSVEALSGWMFNDTLTGAVAPRGGAAGGGAAGPGNNPTESDLLYKNVGLIDGFAELLGTTQAAVDAVVAAGGGNITFRDPRGGGEILIGGAGSDYIQGNLGNDLIDGDAWLNVRIGIDQDGDGIYERSADSLNEIKDELLAGTLKTREMHIVREILQSDTAETDIDTAAYRANRADYTITNNTDGTVTVTHLLRDADGEIVVGGVGEDGIDTLRNIERLQFLDQSVMIDGSINSSPTGTVTINSLSPVVGESITFTSNVADADGIPGTIRYVWQSQDTTGTWGDVAEGQPGVPFPVTVGRLDESIRVVAIYTDGAGVQERVFGTPTQPAVIGANGAPTGGVTITGTAVEDGTLTANISALVDPEGVNTATITYQWFRDNQAVVGANASTYLLGDADVGTQMSVRVSYIDNAGQVEGVLSAQTAAVANVNDAPTIAIPTVAATILEDGAAAGVTVAQDVDGPALSYGTSAATNGTATVDSAGNWSYTPNANFNGTDSFTITVNDGSGAANATATQTVTVTVTAVNDAPTLAAINPTTIDEDGQATGTAVGSDVDGDTLSYSASNGTNGTVSINATTGAWTYTPSANFNGSDSFTVTVSDGSLNGQTSVAVTINAVNDAPVLTGTQAVLADGTEDTSYTVTLAQLVEGFTDTENNILDVAALVASNGATVTGNSVDGYTITPAADYNGTVTLSYNVVDGNGGSTAASLSVSFASVNDAGTGGVTIDVASPNLNQLLTASNTLADVDGIVGPVTYQWQFNNGTGWADIAGATSNTFLTTAAQVGQQLQVVASYSDEFGSYTVVSEATAAVGEFNIIVGTNSADVITGTTARDRIFGHGGNDTIVAGTGDDELFGGQGDDVLDGGIGSDYMAGGAGNDTYYIGSAGDVVFEEANGGFDTVRVVSNYTMQDNIEAAWIFASGPTAAVNVTGNALDNTIIAGDGNNVMDGGAGINSVSYRFASSGVQVSLATTAAQVTFGSGTDTLLNFRHIDGSAYSDILTGNSENNSINGREGEDTLIGGAGNDTYFVDSQNDVIIELANEGTDLVVSTANDYTLSANVENLRILASGAANATGNDGDNLINSGQGNNILNGGLGIDTVAYSFASSGVTVDLSIVGAQNTVGSGVDTISGFENLTGSNFSDTLIGDGSSNRISGGAGTDVIDGGAGNDFLTGGADSDIFRFSASGFGQDRVMDFDSDATGGQDLLDISGLGITAANFSSQVVITDIAGPDILVTIGTDSIRLVNTSITAIDVTDFLLA
jgi:VCBS repeat-containing protein